MSGDKLFPFPRPDFLFVHTVNVYDLNPAEPDARGRRTETYGPVRRTRGYLTAQDPNAQADAGADRVRVDAVLLVPRDFCIEEGAIVTCSDFQLPPNLAGEYRIEVVRPTLVHTRVLLNRYKGVWQKVETKTP